MGIEVHVISLFTLPYLYPAVTVCSHCCFVITDYAIFQEKIYKNLNPPPPLALLLLFIPSPQFSTNLYPDYHQGNTR